MHDNVVFARKGKLALVNAPPSYHNMNRLVPPVKGSKDAVDTIHLFVADTDELDRLLPTALSYKGTSTKLVVLFRHDGFAVRRSRDAIADAMSGHGFKRAAGIGMSGDYGADLYRKST